MIEEAGVERGGSSWQKGRERNFDFCQGLDFVEGLVWVSGEGRDVRRKPTSSMSSSLRKGARMR